MTKAPRDDVADAVTSAWKEITGAAPSTKKTSEVVADVFPEASVAVQVTVVVPSAKEVGVEVTLGLASTKSVAVA